MGTLSKIINVGRRPTQANLWVSSLQVMGLPATPVDPDPGGSAPFPRYDGTVWSRPVGIDYIQWEDQVSPAVAAAQVASPNVPVILTAAFLKGLTGNKILTFPAGEFWFQAGVTNYQTASSNWCCVGVGAGYATGLRGFAGSGSKSTPGIGGAETRFRPEIALGSGFFNMITANRPTAAYFGGFSLYGKQVRGDGVYHSGIVITQSTNALVENVYCRNVSPGYANFPPGETFGINFNQSVNATIREVEVDGRDIAGARTGASPIGWNGPDNLAPQFAKLYRCFGHHGLTGMLTYWQTREVYTEDWYCYSTGSGAGDLRGSGINHEQSGGTIYHKRPVLYLASPKSDWIDKTPNNGMHFGNNTVVDDAGATMTLEEPLWDFQANMSTNMLAMSSRLGYAVTTPGYVGRVGRDYMLTGPTVIKNGVTLNWIQQPASNWTNQNPATTAAWST